MFRHGRPRAFAHNLRLASILSFVAGTVNIAGVLSVNRLTTNVTGHFAFFAEDFVQGRYAMAFTYLVFVMCFLSGAFTCSLLMEMTLALKGRDPHTVPMVLEAVALALLAFVPQFHVTSSHWIANVLLFLMGLQNAMVTKISQATVRTTHLTGLFTDLGIEISQLFFHSAPSDTRKLRRSIYLRLTIIAFFFLGGVLGGYVYQHVQLNVLLVSCLFLLVALVYDHVRLGFGFFRRRLRSWYYSG